MTKKWITLVLVAALCAGALCACGSEFIEAEKAAKIALKDAGLKSSQADVHTHVSSYGGKACYEIHVEAGDDAFTYYIDAQSGDILSREEGVHE